MKLLPKQLITKSPVWIFIKLSVLCALGFIVCVQVYEILRSSNAVPKAPKLNIKSIKNKQLLSKTRDQVRQELAEVANKEKQTSAQKVSKPPLHKALMDPKIYAMIKTQHMHSLDAPYGKLYRELGLDAEQLQKLRELLSEKELALLEGFELARVDKSPLDSPELNALRNESDSAIRELLGDAAFSTYKDYEHTLGTRNHLDILEKRLSYKTEPLTRSQYDALVSALSRLSDASIKSDSAAWLGTYSSDTTIQSLEIAKMILTPSQYAVYEQDYETEMASKAMSEMYAENYAKIENEHRSKVKRLSEESVQ